MADRDTPLAAPANGTRDGTASSSTSNPQPSAGSGSQPSESKVAPTLSGAELKKRAKAEKQARRATERAAREAEQGTDQQSKVRPSNANGIAKQLGSQQSRQEAAKSADLHGNEKVSRDYAQKTAGKGTPRRRDSGAVANTANLPIRQQGIQNSRSSSKSENKPVPFLAHLYESRKRNTLEGIHKDVHPAVAAYGLQIGSYAICGSQARCVAMLKVLKAVISSYITPHGTSLPRHLASYFLSPQLEYIKSCRAFSVTQANAIRWLKNLIVTIDPSVPENTAKSEICNAIDTFIKERFTVADQVICEAVVDQIEDGDVILTFGKSAVVQLALLSAAESSRKFTVVVVDSRPLFEGKQLANVLCSVGIDVSYCLIPGLTYAAQGASKCVLGAHAILGNGSLYSRVGTALVAMQAKACGIPVLACAESIKFTDRVSPDSIVINEIAPEEELFPEGLDAGVANDEHKLADWREKKNLHIVNLLHDLTPAHYLDMIVTELGNLPPQSASVVYRISGGL